MRPDNKPKSSVEYDREMFEHGDIVITISTARVENPWVSIAFGRKSLDPARPSPWIAWERLDEIEDAIEALRESEMGRQAEYRTEQLIEHRQRREGRSGYRNIWNDR
jgi:hypothetical protein